MPAPGNPPKGLSVGSGNLNSQAVKVFEHTSLVTSVTTLLLISQNWSATVVVPPPVACTVGAVVSSHTPAVGVAASQVDLVVYLVISQDP
jgi:hypothetical protein